MALRRAIALVGLASVLLVRTHRLFAGPRELTARTLADT